MNAKKCKALRRIARTRTAGMWDRLITVGKQTAYDLRTGKPYFTEIHRNHPQSTRGVYRALKRDARRTPA